MPIPRIVPFQSMDEQADNRKTQANAGARNFMGELFPVVGKRPV
jgi:hypothetical protein